MALPAREYSGAALAASANPVTVLIRRYNAGEGAIRRRRSCPVSPTIRIRPAARKLHAYPRKKLSPCPPGRGPERPHHSRARTGSIEEPETLKVSYFPRSCPCKELLATLPERAKQ